MDPITRVMRFKECGRQFGGVRPEPRFSGPRYLSMEVWVQLGLGEAVRLGRGPVGSGTLLSGQDDAHFPERVADHCFAACPGSNR